VPPAAVGPGVRQTPTAPPFVEFEQTTAPSPSTPEPKAPQQSAFVRHKSPSTRHPCAGWHMLTPLGPYGAQSRLQQLPQLPPGQMLPSTPVQFTPPLLGWLQMPAFEGVTGCPLGAVQTPPQQSFA
jgi:hypothetical protein